MTESLPREDSASLEPLHLRDYWHVLVRRRALFLFFVVLLVAAGGVLGSARAPGVPGDRADPDRAGGAERSRLRQNARATETGWRTTTRRSTASCRAGSSRARVVERLDLAADPEFMGQSTLGPPPETAAVAPGEGERPALRPRWEGAIDLFLGRLRVQPVKNSQMVAVTFQSGRPELAAGAANTLVEVYIQQTLDFRYRVSAEAGAWLDQRDGGAHAQGGGRRAGPRSSRRGGPREHRGAPDAPRAEAQGPGQLAHRGQDPPARQGGPLRQMRRRRTRRSSRTSSGARWCSRCARSSPPRAAGAQLGEGLPGRPPRGRAA